MNLEAVNRYVLGAIGLFAVCFYIAIVTYGFGDLVSRLPKAGPRKKRSKNLSGSRTWQNPKRPRRS